MRALGPRAQAGDPQAIAALHQTLKELRSFIAQSTQLQSDNTALADARYSLVLAAVDLAAQPAGRRPPDLVPFELLEEARLAAVAFGDAEVAANVAWRTALALRDAHELSRSRAVLESALEELNAPGMAPWLLVTQATLARQRGDWQRALDILSVAEAGLLDESHSFTSHRYTRCALVGLRGQIHIDLGLVGRAALDLAQEKELALELGDLDGWIASLIRRANLHLAREDYEGLARSVEESLASEDLFGGHPGERAQLLVRLGIARSEQERADPSRPRLASGIFHQALADKSLRPGERLTAELFLGDVLLRERALDEAATVLDSARKRLLAWNANDQLRAPAPEAASLATLSARLAVLRVAGKEELARQLTELRHAHGIFLEHWNSTPLRPAGIGFLHYGGRRAVLSELISLTLLVEGLDPGVDHILEHLMEAQALGSVSRRLGIPTGSVDAVREKLIPPGGGLLIYLSGPDRSHLIALDAAGSLYRELLPARELERLRADFVTTVTLPPSVPSTDRLYTTRAARLTTTGRALSRALLPEDIMRRVAGWGPLTVVGIDTLGYLPFEALPIMDDVALLGDRHPIAYTPTLPLGLYLADKATDKARSDSSTPEGKEKGNASATPELTVLIASDPGVEARERWPHLVPLPFAVAERAQLKANWKSGGVSFVEGPRVWEFFPHSNADTDAALPRDQDLSSPETTNLSVLEIIAHGVYDPQRERPAGLALGPRPPLPAPTATSGTNT
ncbi:MAG: hypothetical protein QF411_12155, partial [Planctomycetota bacterium]|nr:hypothetical protein [Planctomycetota bacterium]